MADERKKKRLRFENFMSNRTSEYYKNIESKRVHLQVTLSSQQKAKGFQKTDRIVEATCSRAPERSILDDVYANPIRIVPRPIPHSNLPSYHHFLESTRAVDESVEKNRSVKKKPVSNMPLPCFTREYYALSSDSETEDVCDRFVSSANEVKFVNEVNSNLRDFERSTGNRLFENEQLEVIVCLLKPWILHTRSHLLSPKFVLEHAYMTIRKLKPDMWSDIKHFRRYLQRLEYNRHVDLFERNHITQENLEKFLTWKDSEDDVTMFIKKHDKYLELMKLISLQQAGFFFTADIDWSSLESNAEFEQLKDDFENKFEGNWLNLSIYFDLQSLLRQKKLFYFMRANPSSNLFPWTRAFNMIRESYANFNPLDGCSWIDLAVKMKAEVFAKSLRNVILKRSTILEDCDLRKWLVQPKILEELNEYAVELLVVSAMSYKLMNLNEPILDDISTQVGIPKSGLEGDYKMIVSRFKVVFGKSQGFRVSECFSSFDLSIFQAIKRWEESQYSDKLERKLNALRRLCRLPLDEKQKSEVLCETTLEQYIDVNLDQLPANKSLTLRAHQPEKPLDDDDDFKAWFYNKKLSQNDWQTFLKIACRFNLEKQLEDVNAWSIILDKSFVATPRTPPELMTIFFEEILLNIDAYVSSSEIAHQLLYPIRNEVLLPKHVEVILGLVAKEGNNVNGLNGIISKLIKDNFLDSAKDFVDWKWSFIVQLNKLFHASDDKALKELASKFLNEVFKVGKKQQEVAKKFQFNSKKLWIKAEDLKFYTSKDYTLVRKIVILALCLDIPKKFTLKEVQTLSNQTGEKPERVAKLYTKIQGVLFQLLLLSSNVKEICEEIKTSLIFKTVKSWERSHTLKDINDALDRISCNSFPDRPAEYSILGKKKEPVEVFLTLVEKLPWSAILKFISCNKLGAWLYDLDIWKEIAVSLEIKDCSETELKDFFWDNVYGSYNRYTSPKVASALKEGPKLEFLDAKAVNHFKLSIFGKDEISSETVAALMDSSVQSGILSDSKTRADWIIELVESLYLTAVGRQTLFKVFV